MNKYAINHRDLKIKIKNHSVLMMIMILIFISSLTAADSRKMKEEAEYFDEIIPELMEKYDIPGVSMAIVGGGEMIWSGAYGYANRGRKIPMEIKTVCRAESISKSVTAMGLMTLIEDGTVELDAGAEDYLEGWQIPESRFDEQKVTVRMLLSNSSGLFQGHIGEEYSPNEHMPSLEDYLSREVLLVQEPGKGFIYSNPGFNLLELLIENVSGKKYSEFMEERVFRPLNMSEASYKWSEITVAGSAAGYEMDGTEVPPYLYPANGSGGLLCTVEDIARFSTGLMAGSEGDGPPVLNKISLQELLQPRVQIPGLFSFVADSYAFGHFSERLSDGQQAVWHGGQGHGWMTHFHAVPDEGEAIVIFTNSQRSWPFIAAVLEGWAELRQLPPPRFTIIGKAVKLFSLFTWALFALLILVLFRTYSDFRKREWSFVFDPGKLGIRKIISMLLGLSGMLGIVWAVFQPYLFISSIFPANAPRAAVLIFAIALILFFRSFIGIGEREVE